MEFMYKEEFRLGEELHVEHHRILRIYLIKGFRQYRTR